MVIFHTSVCLPDGKFTCLPLADRGWKMSETTMGYFQGLIYQRLFRRIGFYRIAISQYSSYDKHQSDNL